VAFAGEQYQLPYPGGTGLGKPLKATIHPYRREIPIYLAAEGPKNVALAAELCEGWLPLFFSPKEDAFYRNCLAEGFRVSSDAGKADRFDIAAPMTIVPGDDVENCADAVRPMVALYAGGMGARGANFHFDVFARMGWEAEASKIQELYLAGRKPEAIASVPLAMVEDVALVGPVDKIRGELDRWRDTCLTTMLVSGPKEALPFYADLILG
jgi:F420-dependent oxidoreductase-like protein